jgi:hypothetical protein
LIQIANVGPLREAHNFQFNQLPKGGERDMADDRNRNQGMKEGGFDTGKQGIHESPGKNPQKDKQAGQQGGLNKDDGQKKGIGQPGQHGEEGGQNKQTRR